MPGKDRAGVGTCGVECAGTGHGGASRRACDPRRWRNLGRRGIRQLELIGLSVFCFQKAARYKGFFSLGHLKVAATEEVGLDALEDDGGEVVHLLCAACKSQNLLMQVGDNFGRGFLARRADSLPEPLRVRIALVGILHSKKPSVARSRRSPEAISRLCGRGLTGKASEMPRGRPCASIMSKRSFFSV